MWNNGRRHNIVCWNASVNFKGKHIFIKKITFKTGIKSYVVKFSIFFSYYFKIKWWMYSFKNSFAKFIKNISIKKPVYWKLFRCYWVISFSYFVDTRSYNKMCRTTRIKLFLNDLVYVFRKQNKLYNNVWWLPVECWDTQFWPE